MAKTYYGYKERDTKNRFNWADVGVKISDAIETEAKDRERRKAEEEQAVRDIVKSAGESIPSTADASLNNQILQTTNTQINSLMDAYRDFKSGKGRQNEWVQRRQNMGDNIENYLGLMTDYATMYDKKITRQKNNESLTWEAKAMSQIQDFNDYTKWRVVNNEHDQAFYQRVGPDGELLEGDENKISLAIARKQTTMYYDKFDTNAGVKKAVDMFGVTKLAILKEGVFTREAIQGRDDWKNALRNAAKTELTNSFDRLSILEKDIGANINYVYSQDDVKGTGINEDGSYNVYMKEDPITKIKQPAFTTEQEEAIYTRFEDMILNASDIKETAYEKKVVQGRAPTAPELKAKEVLNLDALIYRKSKEFLENPNQIRYDALGSAGRLSGGGTAQFMIDGNTFNQALTTGDISSTKKLDTSDPQNSLLILFETMGGNKNNFYKLQKQIGRLKKMPTDIEGQTFNTEVTKLQKEVDEKTGRGFEKIAKEYENLLLKMADMTKTGKYASMTSDQKAIFDKLEARRKVLEQEARDQGGDLNPTSGGGSSNTGGTGSKYN